ncbi:MAG: hypothetical protein WDN46_09205 [Methylocella sp.]
MTKISLLAPFAAVVIASAPTHANTRLVDAPGSTADATIAKALLSQDYLAHTGATVSLPLVSAGAPSTLLPRSIDDLYKSLEIRICNNC